MSRSSPLDANIEPEGSGAPPTCGDPLHAHDLRLADPELRDALEEARSQQDVPESLRPALEAHRRSDEYRSLYESSEPLVTVCICTYNRARLLVERCIPSVLTQDYTNLDVVVVGDGCSDDTEVALRGLTDPRLRFVNIARGQYPSHRLLRWLVAGSVPANRSLEMARGRLITHIDDDDEYVPERIGKLVTFLKAERAELVWHPFWHEQTPGEWVRWPATDFRLGQVTTGSVLYLAWLKHVPYDPMAYRYPEPGDWNRYRKFKHLGVRSARHPELLLRHFSERTQL